MPCIAPPEPDDRQLLAYLDGETSPQVAMHLERCSFCREKARRLAHLQGRLARVLYRAACPSTEELGEQHLGLLDGERAAAIRLHLGECPACRRETAQLAGFLDALAPEVQLGARERLQVWIAQLVRKAGEALPPAAPALAPAYAMLRGAEEAPAVYRAGDALVTFLVQDDASAPGRRVLLGLVTGAGTERFSAHLWQGAARLATAQVDDLGNFVFPGLLPGPYEVILAGPGTEVHIQDLELA